LGFNQCDQYGISLNVDKCQFFTWKRKLLSHIISQDGISMDLAKVEVIPLSQFVTKVWAFLGHVGYYQRFIHKRVILASPLINLLKKNQELM
jgi:hypothetical protein